jgi:hypothetical protein
MRFFWLTERIRTTVMLIFLPVTSAQLSGTCIVAFAYRNLFVVSPTAGRSCLVMSVQTRSVAKAPGSLRPSAAELATGLAETNALAAFDGLAGTALDGTVLDDLAAEGEAVGDPMTADAAGAGPLLLFFEVHAPSKASATHAALVAVATFFGGNPLRRSRRCCDKVRPVSAAA